MRFPLRSVQPFHFVIPELDPEIHMDGRNKSGHDVEEGGCLGLSENCSNASIGWIQLARDLLQCLRIRVLTGVPALAFGMGAVRRYGCGPAARAGPLGLLWMNVPVAAISLSGGSIQESTVAGVLFETAVAHMAELKIPAVFAQL
jgi:hypothetical protein